MEELSPRSALVSRPWLVVAALGAVLAVVSVFAVRRPSVPGVEPRAPRDHSAEPPGASAGARGSPVVSSGARDVRAPAPSTATRAEDPAPASRPVEPPVTDAAVSAADTSADAAALLADAREARRRGDLRTQLALLEAAVELAPGVETHAALGTLYLELGAARRAEKQLRAAAEGDPGNADLWIALANALALEPDPFAAADALARARAAEPGARITRDASGRLVREPSPPS